MTLTSQEAQAYYNQHAAKQNRQGWYEDAALDWLCEHGQFEHADCILEVGCGTGRFAARLRKDLLSADATYCGYDISDAMLQLAGKELPNDATILVRGDATRSLPFRDASFDRLIAAYTLDLFSDDDARAMLAEAHRVLMTDGLLCLASLSSNRSSGLARVVGTLWTAVQWIAPSQVGGCRPIDLSSKLKTSHWDIVQHGVVEPRRVASEVVIAKRV